MKRWCNIIWVLLATLALASSAFAQGGGASSTGSISGEVKDAQGGVLPGVTVTATSPAQISSLTAVTNEAGLYRFPAVPPGEYRLAYDLAGFQANVRSGIRITLGFNGQVNVTMNVATLQETVTVSGQSPVIDTAATRIQTNYDQHRVEKQMRLAQKAKFGLFFDLFNAMNSNVNVNENWRPGAAFEKATTVLGPRITKFGVRFDW